MLFRDERYKLIWGTPGQTDGYGLDTEFIWNLHPYIQAAKDYTTSQSGMDKRGGPYIKNEAQQAVETNYLSMTQVTQEQLDAGTGYMMLFDLKGMCSTGHMMLFDLKGM